MEDAIRKILTAGAPDADSSVFVLVLGGNILYPEHDIKGVEVQLVGDESKSVLFELLSVRVAATAGEVTDCQRWYRDGGWVGAITHLPDNGGKRSYMVGLVVKGTRPKALRVRLTAAGGDDCEVLLTALEGDLVRGVAAGTEWHEWPIPSSDRRQR